MPALNTNSHMPIPEVSKVTTVVRQVGAPLASRLLLRSRELSNPDIPCYPMMPYNTQRDMYYETLVPQMRSDPKSGLIRSCPYQDGEWHYEPFYGGGAATPVFIDVKTGEVYSRWKTRMASPDVITDAMRKGIVEKAQHSDWPEEVKFLHCLRFVFPTVGGTVGSVDGQAILIIDAVWAGHTYLDRRKLLESTYEQLTLRLMPSATKPTLILRVPESKLASFWAVLHLQNQTFAEGSELFHGIVGKQGLGHYIMQSSNSSQKSILWMNYPFHSRI